MLLAKANMSSNCSGKRRIIIHAMYDGTPPYIKIENEKILQLTTVLEVKYIHMMQ